MSVGDVTMFRCETCYTEFKIVYEPDYGPKKCPGEMPRFNAKHVRVCPFCAKPEKLIVKG